MAGAPQHRAEAPAAPMSPEQAAENEARRNRAALLRAFDSSTLTRANFCALKGLTETTLETQLAQARAEAPPRPREPRPEAPPQWADRPDRGGDRSAGRPDRGGPRSGGFGAGRPGGPGGPGRSGPRPDIRTDLRNPRPVPAAVPAPVAMLDAPAAPVSTPAAGGEPGPKAE
jgi:hypothetical protein